MRARRTTTPLLPVNSRHLRSKSSSLQCLRLVFTGAILLVVAYSFIAYGGQTHTHRSRRSDAHPSGSSSGSVRGDAEDAAEAQALSVDAVHPYKASLSAEDETPHHHHPASHKRPQFVDSPAKVKIYVNAHQQLLDTADGVHAVHSHSADPVKVNADATEHQEPTATLQEEPVKQDAAHPQAFPDGSHQVAEENLGRESHFPDATHQLHARHARNEAGREAHVRQARTDTQSAGTNVVVQSASKPLVDAKVQHDSGEDAKEAKDPAVTPSPPSSPPEHKQRTAATGLYQLSALDIEGTDHPLERYQGKVALVVNVASACGYTDENYKGLQALYEKYSGRGLVVLGFPCNQFGGQEAGSLQEIRAFCTSRYHVTFPMFAKVEVNGPNTHPVYRYLRRELPESEGGGGGKGEGQELVWNFNKFLVDHTGRPVRFYKQTFDGALLQRDIETLLNGITSAR